MPAYPKTNWCTRLLAILCLSSALDASAQTTLIHRYSFNDTAGSSSFADSAGSATGSVNNDTAANPTSASLDGSQLQLDGTGGYALLPAGMISGNTQVTIETWVSLGSNPTWTRLFAFGDQNSGNENTGVDFCPFAPGNYQNLNIQSPAGGGYANNPTSLNNTTNFHVTVVFDPVNNSKYYYNGSAIVSTDHGTTPALNTINDAYGLIGRSLFDLDPTVIGSVDEFRIYSGVLSPAAVALNDATGPNNYVTNPGTVVALHFSSPTPTLTINQSVQQTLRGDFTSVSNLDLIAYGGATFTSLNSGILTISTNGVVKAVGTGTASIVASYGSKSATNSLSVSAPPTLLVHRYSFTTDASDSVGGADGTLQGSAMISGGQLVLDGSFGSYLSLPGNLINLTTNAAVTIDAWVTFGDPTTWAELFAFGNTNAGNGINNIASVPAAEGGGFRHWGITENFPSNGHTPGLSHSLSDVTAHVTAVIDPPTGTISIYRDGVLEVGEYDATAPLSNIATNYAFIGRSMFDADPYLPASINEFRIYNGALTPAQVALVQAGGVTSTNLDLGALSSITVVKTNYPAYAALEPPMVLANYANLAGFNLLPTVTAGGNVAFSGSNGLVITSSDPGVISVNAQNLLTTFRPGTVTLTASFGGKTNSAVVSVGNKATLTHRYSFTTDASDSIGSATGVTQGSATVSAGQLQLTGNNSDYLMLPTNLLASYDSVTIDTWVTFADVQNWARLWEFTDVGSGTQNEFYYAPGWNPNPPNAQVFNAGFPYGGGTQVAGALTTQTYHITCEYGNGELAVYTNGVLEAEITNQVAPASSAGLNSATIGHSPFNDPGINGSIDEFRIYNGLLAADEIKASDVLGPDQTLSTAAARLSFTNTGGQVVLRWPVASAGFVPQATPSLNPSSWVTLTNLPALVNSTGSTNWQVSVPVGSSSRYFRLIR